MSLEVSSTVTTQVALPLRSSRRSERRAWALLRGLITTGILVSEVVAAPQFGGGQVVTNQTQYPRHVYAADLDGDGDLDVLSASAGDDTIAWYENTGTGFGPQQVISTTADWVNWIEAHDLDGDGDPDVIAASSQDNKIAWYENLGAGVFTPESVVTNLAVGAYCVRAADLDGDGDQDLLAVSRSDGTVAWYPNLGMGAFGSQMVITSTASDPTTAHAADLDGDGELDVLVASLGDSKVTWFPNLGAGAFGVGQVIAHPHSAAYYVDSGDIDGDGAPDVLAGFYGGTVVWFPNLGGGVFGVGNLITTTGSKLHCSAAIDLDGDADLDVLTASYQSGLIAWHENLGGGSFSPDQVISSGMPGTTHAIAADLDGDGDCDVLGTSHGNQDVEWFENLAAWHLSPVNGHWYRRTGIVASWDAAEAMAQTWGGHLATIRSAAEDQWLMGLYSPDNYWIGFNDAAVEGSWVWSSGETPSYTNWAPGEPNNTGGEDYCEVDPVNFGGSWNDVGASTTYFGVVEVISGDCDANSVPDAFQIAQAQWLDWNGDGVLDECSSPNYCTATANSTGVPAVIGASGSPLVGDNAFTLEAWNVPAQEWGYFLMSQSTAFVPGFGGSAGNLCLGQPIIRFNNPNNGGMPLNSGAGGAMAFTLDLTSLPQGTVFSPGDAWYFQLWLRDIFTSNTTDGIEVMFR